MRISYKTGMPTFLGGVVFALMTSYVKAACNSPSGIPYDYTITITIEDDHKKENIYLTDRVQFSVEVTNDQTGDVVPPSDLSYQWSGGTREGSNTESTYTTHFSSAPIDQLSSQQVTVKVEGTDWECTETLPFNVYPYKIHYENQSVVFNHSITYNPNHAKGPSGGLNVTSLTLTTLEGNVPQNMSSIEPLMNLETLEKYIYWEEDGTILEGSGFEILYSGECYGSEDPQLTDADPEIEVTWSLAANTGTYGFLYDCKQLALESPNNVGGQDGVVVHEIHPDYDETKIGIPWTFDP